MISAPRPLKPFGKAEGSADMGAARAQHGSGPVPTKKKES
jgi:hypothetical protein